MYKRVEAPTSVRRQFAVTISLAEGYGDNQQIHTVEEAVQVSLVWMKKKAAAGKQYLTGSFTPGTVVYAWPEGEGKAGGGNEPNVTFHGEVSVLYNADLSDEDVKAILDDFASHMGEQLGQTRVYVAYCDETWVLQAEEKTTPTGETV